MLGAALAAVAEYFFPDHCGACDRALFRSQGMCAPCLDSCQAIGAACPRCALPLAGTSSVECASCLRGAPVLDRCLASYEYGGQMEVLLKRLKFCKRPDIARVLRPLLQDQFELASADCDLAIPIPLFRRRHRIRGYNQSMRLLLPLARAAGQRVGRGVLERCKDTAPQATLAAAERSKNLEGAFVLKRSVEGRRILLLDDVATTGATLRAAAKELKRGGAREVCGYVVARARSPG